MFTKTTIIAFSSFLLTASAATSPPNVICTVNYATNPSIQPVVQKCCANAGGFPINFREAKLEGCQNLLLRSPQNLKFVGCVQDKLKITPACSNADPIPVPTTTKKPTKTTTTPTSTVTPVYCDVNYHRSSVSKNIVASCCQKADGVPESVTGSSTLERCNGLILRSPKFDQFYGCVGSIPDNKLACYPQTTPTAIPAPVPTDVICTANYKDARKQAAIKSCCGVARGQSINFREAKIQGCEGLKIGGKNMERFVNCVREKVTKDVRCATQ